MKPILVLVAIALLGWLGFRGFSGKGGAVAFPMRVISTPTEAQSVPEASRIRVLLFTGTEWCPACKNLEASVISTPAWKDFAQKEIRFRSFDFPADRSQATALMNRMAQQYGVRAFPTMIVLDPENEELGRQAGSGPPVENFKTWIREHARYYPAGEAAGQTVAGR